VKRHTIIVLPGDGIGPEVVAEAERVLGAVSERFGVSLALEHELIGAAAVRATGSPFPERTAGAVARAGAVLLGAVGDPAFDGAPRAQRPETGLLALRRAAGAYANLRPVAAHPALAARSPLKAERLAGVDVLIVRELLGGVYYGEPRGRDGARAFNTMSYTEDEVARVAHVAFAAARTRRGVVTSVDKANVLEVSQLWRAVVTRVARDYPDVRLEHCYVDMAALRLVAEPERLDVVLAENLFGDILSDEAAVLAGSLGLLPSASLGNGPGVFEPVHGSAPDLAGRDRANPIGAIASAALLLRHGLALREAADAVDEAIRVTVASGARTADIAAAGEPVLGTRAMGRCIADAVLDCDPVPAAAGPAAGRRAGS
jgi:3-isopropylmalate dehydrogenase